MFNFIKRLEKVEEEVYLENSDNFLCPLAERVERLKTANNNLASRLILLESHLNLTYIPASEEKKEARYETTKRKFEDRIFGFDKDSDKIDSLAYWTTLAGRPTQKIKKTKKK